MKIEVIAVGKVKEAYLRDGIAEYEKRIGAYSDLKITSIQDEPFGDKDSPKRKEEIKSCEGEKILSKLRPSSFVIVCDLAGEELSSEGFSNYVAELALSGKSDLTFIIGGALGLSDGVLKKADFVLCFSKMTFPHQLMRMILLEQIYRAFKIMRKEPYHY